MKNLLFRTLASAVVAFAAAPVAADDGGLLAEARGVAASIPPRLLAVLQQEMEKNGPAAAIGVCRDKAPQMAQQASEASGWRIRRVSLKNRNPKAVPDTWERAVLEDFDRRAAAGEAPATLEKGEILGDGNAREYRYMKALPTQTLCLACHGTSEEIDPAVKARLDALYPDDKAIGYVLGDIRGAMTIRRPL